ncbi:hypothetical protein BD289DRAFT_142834 [Coniella lustricola]|uniref:Rhodopsin domain-containing protein n=1 Tax=Coniella lustricola TaxID=2025994 RepID=A0A2T2ZV67_9PEZI|nr:hypothetical protein BD289DRAFT_142834 [Coniella lustricola]
MTTTASNRGPEFEAVCLSFLVLCLITVSLRTYTMCFILKRFFVEDYLAVLTLLIYIGFTVLALLSVSFGLGQHDDDVSVEDLTSASKYCFIAAVVYIVLSYLVKVIVGLFLARICSASNQKWQRTTIYIMFVFVGIFYGAYFFIAIFACQPVEYVWLRDNPNSTVKGECNPSVAATSISYIATGLNCVADWMLSLLPALVVWRAKLDRRTKMSIILILAFGSIASVATLIRVFYAKELVNHNDYLYNFTPLATWSTIEVGTALTASSLATLKPLFRKFTAVFNSTIATNTNTTGATADSQGRYPGTISSTSLGGSSGVRGKKRSAYVSAQLKYARHQSDYSMVFGCQGIDNGTGDSKAELEDLLEMGVHPGKDRTKLYSYQAAAAAGAPPPPPPTIKRYPSFRFSNTASVPRRPPPTMASNGIHSSNGRGVPLERLDTSCSRGTTTTHIRAGSASPPPLGSVGVLVDRHVSVYGYSPSYPPPPSYSPPVSSLSSSSSPPPPPPPDTARRHSDTRKSNGGSACSPRWQYRDGLSDDIEMVISTSPGSEPLSPGRVKAVYGKGLTWDQKSMV